MGRWHSTDPLAEPQASYTPYHYTYNNPLRFIDPDGLAPEPPRVRIYTEIGFPAGHVFVTVGSGENTTVYTYGRYARVDKPDKSIRGTSPTGEGVLIKLQGEKAQEYIKTALERDDAQVFDILDADGDKVSAFFDQKLEESEESPEIGKYKDDPDAKIIDTYKLDTNNCTTISCEGVKKGGTGVSFKSFATVTKGGVVINTEIATPRGLQNHLRILSQFRSNKIKEATQAAQSEYPK